MLGVLAALSAVALVNTLAVSAVARRPGCGCSADGGAGSRKGACVRARRPFNGSDLLRDARVQVEQGLGEDLDRCDGDARADLAASVGVVQDAGGHPRGDAEFDDLPGVDADW